MELVGTSDSGVGVNGSSKTGIGIAGTAGTLGGTGIGVSGSGSYKGVAGTNVAMLISVPDTLDSCILQSNRY